MSTAAIVIIVILAIGITAAILYFLFNSGGAEADRRLCVSCQRAMAPGWTSCMFCGWAPVPRLEFMSGPLAGQVMQLTEEVTTVGSVAGTTIVLSDPAVSRKHMAIRRDGHAYEFADLGSTNGVYVNGHRVAKKTLASGDILRVGNTEMVFRRE